VVVPLTVKYTVRALVVLPVRVKANVPGVSPASVAVGSVAATVAVCVTASSLTSTT